MPYALSEPMRTAALVRRDRQGRTRYIPARYPRAITHTLNGITLGWNGSLP